MSSQHSFNGPLYYGGDYNPEQWPEEVWHEDVKLMQEAGVNLVSLAIFAWTNIEVADGIYDFDWLDRIIGLLHEGGIGVDLATATASPPAWLVRQYPEMLPVTSSGTRLDHGGRQHYCISSPIYKAKAAALAGKLAERYGDHPAVKLWHVNNEYGCHNPMCFCDISAEAFRAWLQTKYDSLDDLNHAWGTNFWSQRYHAWSEINPPRQTPMGTAPNPTMFLDWQRFGNWQILELYKAERDAIRATGAKQPITTNFMTMWNFRFLNYFEWAKEVDLVSTDHYLMASDPDSHIDLAFQADLTRGFAAGRPWLLMEHSTSAVNWQPTNFAKAGGQELLNSMSHVARGSNGSMYFQWRASIAGSEKFHSTMLPHAGTDTRIWRTVKDLGAKLASLEDISGKDTLPAKVAMVFDHESWWALSQPNLPSTSIDYPDLAHEWYAALWRLGCRVDLIPAGQTKAQLEAYDLVLLPMTYLMPESHENELLAYAQNGGSVLVSYFTGISDEHDHVKMGGYGGRLVREALGVFVEEFAPAAPGTELGIDSGLTAGHWQQWAKSTKADAISTFTDGPAAGSVAIAKTWVGRRPSWYLGTRLTAESNLTFFHGVLKELGIEMVGGNGVEVIDRGDLRFTLDHNQNTVSWAKRD